MDETDGVRSIPDIKPEIDTKLPELISSAFGKVSSIC
jgi:hypothetical protein